MIKNLKPFLPFFLPLMMMFSLSAVYLLSMAPGLTWAHFGADGGDLITAAATGGVAHPSGYPLYLLLARLFQYLPVGPLAYRTNLLSAASAVSAVLLVYLLSLRFKPAIPPGFSRLAGLAAGYALGLSPLFWSQAVITEVYSLHLFFMALLLYLSFGLPQGSKNWKLDLLSGLVLGLALGNHVTSILLLPVVLGVTFQRWRPDLPRLSLRLAGLAVGALVYLILPLRGLSMTPLNWGDPATLDGFFWLVSGQLYRGQFLALPLPSLLERISALAALLWGQFGLPGLLLGLGGLFGGQVFAPLQRSLLWISAVSVAFALAYDTSDSFLYLLPAVLCFALWIGAGLGWVLAVLMLRWPRAAFGTGAAFLAFLFIWAGTNWTQVDASHDQRAEEFGEQALSALPANALVFAQGDQAVFALWYFHFALEQRPDLVIVATDLLQFPWYLDSLRVTYPSLAIPVPFPFEQMLFLANPARASCRVTYNHWAQIYCQPITGSGE